MSAGVNKQGPIELARVVQLLRDETLVHGCEKGARGILENPNDTRRDEAQRLLELRPAIRRRYELGLPYGDLIEEFWRLAERARLKIHAAKSRPRRSRQKKQWAQDLAAEIRSWEEIPEQHNCPLEIETLEATLKFYRDGDKVVCLIKDGEGTRTSDLAESTFKRYYLRPALKERG